MRLDLVILLMCCCTGACFATSMRPPQAWSRPTPDGRAVFVMLLPEKYKSFESADSRALRKKYPKSGLYPGAGATIPYWSIEGYANEWNVVLSFTGEYVAAHYLVVSGHSYCLAFHARGKVVKTWTAEELDPAQVREVSRRQNIETTNYSGYWRGFGLQMEKATVSSDGRLEIPSMSSILVFAIQTGELLSRAPSYTPEDRPVSAAEFEAFCRVLGTTGTRNPNFVSGLPEPEFELVPIPAPKRRAVPRIAVSPYDRYRFISPPLPADPTDWRWYVLAGTALSYALCFSAIRMRSRKSR